MAIGVFRPNRGKPLEQRIRDIEQHLAQLSLDPETIQQILGGGGGGGSGGGSSVRLPLPESQVKWDPTAGHMHDGTDAEGAKISHANLDPATVTADQHHAQVHELASTAGLGADHTVAGLSSGQVLKATGSTTAQFELLGHDELDPASITANQHHAQVHVLATVAGLGSDHTVSGLTENQVLKAIGSSTARFELLGHDELDPATIGEDDHHPRAHVLLGSAGDHSDSATGLTLATGDLIYRNGSSLWTRLGIGSAGDILRVVGGVPAWVAHTFAIITGTISAAQHGNLTSTAGSTADHTGTLSANACVNVQEAGVSVGTQRAINLIEGANVALDIVDDAANDRVNVTIAQASVTAATIIVQEGDVTVEANCDSLDFAAGDFDVTSDPAGEANIAWHGFTVQEGDSNIDTACKTLDFKAGDFNVTSSPSGEANIAWQGVTVEEGEAVVATDVKALDFGAGFDVTASGGEAEIGIDLSEVVTGDVTFATNAATVAALNGITAPTPGSGDDLKLLRYNHASGAYELVTVTSVATSSAIIQAWRRNSLQNAATSKSQMPGLDSVTTGTTMYKAGRVVAVALDMENDPTDFVDNPPWFYEVEVYKRTPAAVMPGYSATGLTARLTASTNDEVNAYGIGSVAFAAGDQITVYDQRLGFASSTIAAKATVWVVYD